MPLRKAEQMVKEFHLKNGYKVNGFLTEEHNMFTESVLQDITENLFKIQKTYQELACRIQETGDARLYRTLLIVEELAEIVDAMANKNEIELADGLGDLMYVVIGTAITYSIPLYEVFAEIQKANMAKKKRSKDDPRMRDKGEEWKRPNIKGAIEKGRQNVNS